MLHYFNIFSHFIQYFHFLISGLENDIWGLIGELDHARAQEKPPLRAQILSALACFIAIADAIGEPLPYRDLDGFLQNGIIEKEEYLILKARYMKDYR